MVITWGSGAIPIGQWLWGFLVDQTNVTRRKWSERVEVMWLANNTLSFPVAIELRFRRRLSSMYVHKPDLGVGRHCERA